MENSEKRLTIKDLAEDDRPREKMERKGASSLSDAELIAILLRAGNASETAVDVAQRLLGQVNNSLNELARLSLHQFTKIKGIGRTKAITILAALELGRRRSAEGPVNRERIFSSRSVIDIFQPALADLPHEEFWVLLLNKANRIIERVKVSQGGVGGTVVDPKLVLKHAVERLASAIIVVHNHPSGNPQPSDKDIALTEKLKNAAQLFDITLLDHVIVTDGECYSFADNGKM
ncbi:MAG TPA: DNA repair protein RadC [Tenuifilum sp.]|uniref:RadC family protein n=3 Tax=Tenuifilum sp. TaxID=2760880 RepID=UPI002C74EE9A|nr:DNA repair protein RadC [Tenuifilum sp.]HRU86910.1 DNA repair protein RadC [Tenuifilum sp.]